jgi:hypothetical protein
MGSAAKVHPVAVALMGGTTLAAATLASLALRRQRRHARRAAVVALDAAHADNTVIAKELSEARATPAALDEVLELQPDDAVAAAPAALDEVPDELLEAHETPAAPLRARAREWHSDTPDDSALGSGARATVHAINAAFVEKRAHSGDEEARIAILKEARNIHAVREKLGCKERGLVSSCSDQPPCCDLFPSFKVDREGRRLVLSPRGVDLARAASAFASALAFTDKRVRPPPDCEGATWPLSWPDLRLVFVDVVDAVQCLHANKFFHGDVKPTNVLVHCCLRQGRRRYRAVLSDLESVGEIVAARSKQQDLFGHVFTLAYATPQRIGGTVDPRAEDAYATMMTLKETLRNWRRAAEHDGRWAKLPENTKVEISDALENLSSALKGDGGWDLRLDAVKRLFAEGSYLPPEDLKCPRNQKPGEYIPKINAHPILKQEAKKMKELYQDPPGCVPCPQDTLLAGRCVRRTTPDNCAFALLPSAPVPPEDPLHSSVCKILETSDAPDVHANISRELFPKLWERWGPVSSSGTDAARRG